MTTGAGASVSAIIILRLSSYDKVYAEFFEASYSRLWDTGVGDYDVDIRNLGDFAEPAAAEFAGVGEYDGFLGCSHHGLIEFGFADIGCGDAEVEVDAVNAEE